MLQFLVLGVTFFAVFAIAAIPFGIIVRFLKEEGYESSTIEQAEKIISAVVFLVAVVACYFGPWQYTFPAVFSSDYVATYEDGKVVKHPYGTWSYAHEGEVFRVLVGVQSENRSLGDVTVSYKPYVHIESVLFDMEIVDPDLYFSDPSARVWYASPYTKLINETLSRAQRTIFAQIGFVERIIDCHEVDYYGKVAELANQEFRKNGFEVSRVRSLNIIADECSL